MVECTQWICDNDLTKYVDSMLYDSDTVIAQGTFVSNTDVQYDISLVVTGAVAVYFNDIKYTQPSDFPQALKEIIRKRKLFSSENVTVWENNWFAYIVTVNGYTDDVVFEADLSTYTDQMLQDEMKEIVRRYW